MVNSNGCGWGLGIRFICFPGQLHQPEPHHNILCQQRTASIMFLAATALFSILQILFPIPQDSHQSLHPRQRNWCGFGNIWVWILVFLIIFSNQLLAKNTPFCRETLVPLSWEPSMSHPFLSISKLANFTLYWLWSKVRKFYREGREWFGQELIFENLSHKQDIK